MVSHRCKMVVEEQLKKMRLPYIRVDLGVIEMEEVIKEKQLKRLKGMLLKCGLELLEDKKSILIERIKNVIIEMIYYSEKPKIVYSDYLSQRLQYDYTYLSNVFSEEKGITIQQFIIINKIEKVKQLLFYGELTLTQIASALHYSSVSHLSGQFKKVTGFTPSIYKLQKNTGAL
ncbi:MAG: AraC family transcriptional regulator [Chitinophagaceae bacterium]|nr:AraC family transcriptional regulator [Chitinophagaceae bacterium]